MLIFLICCQVCRMSGMYFNVASFGNFWLHASCEISQNKIVGRCRASLHALQSRFAVHERRGRKLHRQQEENRQGHLISNHVHYCTLAQLSSRPLFTSYFWRAMSLPRPAAQTRILRCAWYALISTCVITASYYSYLIICV